MDGKPWSPEVLDWLASDFVAHKYDLKHLIATILTSRAYQMPAVPRTGEPPARGYAFRGPEIRRLTAEQFADAHRHDHRRMERADRRPRLGTAAAGGRGRRRAAHRLRLSDQSGIYVREYRNISSHLTRALGRPIRDQVTSVRARSRRRRCRRWSW